MIRFPTMAACALATVALSASASAQMGRMPIPFPGRPGGNAAPTAAEREFSAGEVMLRAGDADGARARFEAARRLDARDPRPVFYLGEVARQRAQWAEAEGLFREAIRLRPAMAEAHAELGAALREQGRLPDAVASLEQAVRLSPTLGEAHQTLALCLDDQGDATRAAQEYRRAMQLLADDPMPALNLGILLANRAPPAASPERAEAVRVLREAVRRGRAQRDVLAAAGPGLRQVGEARDAATALERARTLGAPTSTILGELAQALWVVGDRAVAEQRMAEAIALSPREATLRYVHGLMLADANQREQSLAELRQAATLGAGTGLAARAEARIRALGGAPSARAPAATGGPRRRP